MSKNGNKLTALLLSLCLAVSGIMPMFASDVTDTAESSEEAVYEEELLSGKTADAPVYTYRIDGLGNITAATVEPLGASASYYNYKTDENGTKQSAHAVVGDMSRGAFTLGVSLGDRFGARGKLTALKDDAESENRLVAAVNADFFSTSTGVPMGVFVNEGRFVSSSDGRYAIGIGEDGSVTLGTVGDSISIVHRDRTLEVAYLNKYPTVYGAYLLTGDFGTDTRLSSSIKATEYIIELEGDILLGESVSGEIKEIRTSEGASEIPEGCAVLVVPDIYDYSELYRALEIGDEIEVVTSVNEEFRGVVNAIGGGDIILRDGEMTDTLEDESIETARNPRTAIGITADGKIVLFVVDGRKAGVSSGIKATALADAMKSLGCTDAINLDGGGSSIMVLYGAGTSKVVNTPSDGVERSVPNAVVLYENREAVKELHILEFSASETLLFSGAKIPLALELKSSDGETAQIEFTEENTVFSMDKLFGSITFEEGIPTFTAGNFDGVGKITATVTIDDETVTADLFLQVTTAVDTLTLDQNIILADGDAAETLNISAKVGDSEVWFGDTLTVSVDSEDIVYALDGRALTLSLIKAENEENTETEAAESEIPEIEYPSAASGTVTVTLGGMTASVPAYFDSELTLNIGEFIAPFVTVTNEGYTVTYDAAGGVMGEGAFVAESPVIEEVPAETTGIEDGNLPDFIAEPAETVENTEISEIHETAEPVEAAEPIETAEPVEAAEPIETAEPVETAEMTDETGTDETAETEEPEPVFEPFEVKINADGALVSNGLSNRRIWLWADGITSEALPYAVFETADGDVTLYYERFYDFLDYSGRALLTLSLDGIEGIASLKTLFAYTAYEEEQSVTLSAPIITETLDTNMYADTAEHWSSYYVNALSYMGIVNGSENLYGELVYTPDGGLSREQFAKILVNYLKIDIEEYAETPLEFADIDSIAPWALPYVRAAVGAGLMKGRSTPADTVIFAPTDGIKRQEAIYVLGGLLEGVEASELSFTDSGTVAPWAAENLSKALTAGLISGYDDGSLRPEGGITRAEAATVVVRLYEFSSES